jgi:hypothetical protein
VSPKLESLSTPTGESLQADTRVGVAEQVTRAIVALEVDDETVTRDIDSPGETITANWTLDNGSARLVGVDGSPVTGDNTSVPTDATENVGLRITLVDTGGNTYTYQQWTAVQSTPAGVQAVSPAERRVCRLTTDCDPADAYLPDDPAAHPDWVAFKTTLSATG